MQIEQTEDELTIRETPGCLWLFGLFFAIIGGLFVYGSVGGFVNWGSQPLWILVVTFVFGAIGFGAGIWIIHNAPITKLIVNRHDNRIFLIRYGILGRHETFYLLDDIEQFSLIEETDTDGDKTWYLGMKLNVGDELKISSFGNYKEDFVRNTVFSINEFSRKQIAPTEMIFESEDETGSEIS